MKLDCLTLRDVEKVRIWRNNNIESLRTPFFLTEEMQKEFYENKICNRNSNCRFWAVRGPSGIDFFGMVGLVNIEWENRLGEISIIIAPNQRGKGKGTNSIELLLDAGFNQLNLTNIYGECYTLNENYIKFWDRICGMYNATKVTLPGRKYWDGNYYNSLYFNINKYECDQKWDKSSNGEKGDITHG
ncbi:MAG: GNAT family protein [Clostridiales bacterium]